MRTVFWIGAIWIGYVYVGYLAALAIVALWRRVRPVLSDHPEWPTVSVLISARNEEQDIGWKIAETLAWDYPQDRLTVLVASDASDDATDAIVRGIADARVTFLRMERRGGKIRALNRLAELAQGEILFFTDANAHIGPDALKRMVRHFSDPRVGCVTGDSRSIEEKDNPAVSEGANVYWGYECILKRLENSLGSVLVCDGAIFCMRASLYQPQCPDLANDLESPMRVGFARSWVMQEPAALVFERDTNSPRQEFNRRRRMCAQGMLAMIQLPGTCAGLRGWQFISHKFLRWLSLIPMLMVLAGSVSLARESAFFTVLVGLQTVFYTAAAAGLVCAVMQRPIVRIVAVPFYVVLGVTGALVGVVESLLGKRFDIWEIPTLSRGPGAGVIGGVQRAE